MGFYINSRNGIQNENEKVIQTMRAKARFSAAIFSILNAWYPRKSITALIKIFLSIRRAIF